MKTDSVRYDGDFVIITCGVCGTERKVRRGQPIERCCYEEP